MVERTSNGRAFRILNIIDEFTRECLSITVIRKINSQDVIDELFNLFIFRGIPEHIRSDNGPEFTAKAVRKWLERLGVNDLPPYYRPTAVRVFPAFSMYSLGVRPPSEVCGLPSL